MSLGLLNVVMALGIGNAIAPNQVINNPHQIDQEKRTKAIGTKKRSMLVTRYQSKPNGGRLMFKRNRRKQLRLAKKQHKGRNK